MNTSKYPEIDYKNNNLKMISNRIELSGIDESIVKNEKSSHTVAFAKQVADAGVNKIVLLIPTVSIDGDTIEYHNFNRDSYIFTLQEISTSIHI